MRTGMHHCQGGSSQESSSTELRARASQCPFCAPLPLTCFTGLNSPNFLLNPPALSQFTAIRRARFLFASTSADLSARAPPVLL
jgi:hypothetical protein